MGGKAAAAWEGQVAEHIEHLALVLAEPGKLVVQDVGPAQRKENSLLLSLEYSSIQPLDGEAFAGRRGPGPGPLSVLGAEGVGRVEETFDEAKFPVGCRVAFVVRRFGEMFGCWRSQVCVSPDDFCVSRLPMGLAPQTVAAGVTSTFLAMSCLRHFRRGDCIIVVPSCGATGLSLIQLASSRGIRVVGLLRGSDRAAWITKEFGASGLVSLVDLLEDEWPSLVGVLVGSQEGGPEAAAEGASAGADGLIDGSGGELMLQAAQALRPRATIVSYGNAGGAVEEAALAEAAEARLFRVVREDVRNALVASDAELHFEAALELMAKGRYRPHCWQLMDWRDAQQGMVPQLPTSRFASQLSSGKRVGRIILKFGTGAAASRGPPTLAPAASDGGDVEL